MKNLKIALAIIILSGCFYSCSIHSIVLAVSPYSQTIQLNAGWNIISTPRILSSHSFSADQISSNFDIYLLDPSKPSKWATMADIGHSEFQPLYGYFINNKTGVTQTLTFYYRSDLTPNEQIFEREFNQEGWYSVGPANPTYVKSKCADTADTNNVSKVLHSLDGFYNLFIDFIDHSVNARNVGVNDKWNTVIDTDVDQIDDLRELNGYALYINKANAIYNGVQSNEVPEEQCWKIGTITVSMSANHPQGADGSFVKTTNLKTLAVFDIKADDEAITLNTINLLFTDSVDALTNSNYLSNVGLYDGDSLISNLLDVKNEASQSFSINWTISAGVTKELSVKGITDTITAITNGDSIVTTFDSALGQGESSGETINNYGDLATTAITIYPSGIATPSTDATRVMHNQGILAPMVNAPIGAIKIYGQREDMKLTDWIVYVSGTGYDDEADISSVTIYDQDGTTQLSNPVAYDNGDDNTVDTFTFTSSDFLTDVIIPKNTYRTLIIKANTSTAIDGTTDFLVTLKDQPDQMKFVGQDSGTIYDTSTDIVGDLALNITSPFAGGKFSFDEDILEVKKANESPSGAVSRGTIATYAIWDVTNMSSTLSAMTIDSVTFTSKTGLPSGILDADNSASGDLLFSLYDGDGNILAGGAAHDNTVIFAAAGTVTFTKANLLTVDAGLPKQLVLKITTTNTALWPSSTQMQWSIETVGDLISSKGTVGYAGTTWSIPATTNIVTLP